MRTKAGTFDLNAFHAALDAERRAQDLTWNELAHQINRPFAQTSSIPISVGTLQNMPGKRSVTSAVVLQALRWLGRTPESFLTGSAAASAAFLPSPRPASILRFDTRKLHAALNARRIGEQMTWKQLADQLPGFTPATLQNLATGPLIGFPRVMRLTQWLGRPAADFVRACRR